MRDKLIFFRADNETNLSKNNRRRIPGKSFICWKPLSLLSRCYLFAWLTPRIWINLTRNKTTTAKTLAKKNHNILMLLISVEIRFESRSVSYSDFSFQIVRVRNRQTAESRPSKVSKIVFCKLAILDLCFLYFRLSNSWH